MIGQSHKKAFNFALMHIEDRQIEAPYIALNEVKLRTLVHLWSMFQNIFGGNLENQKFTLKETRRLAILKQQLYE